MSVCNAEGSESVEESLFECWEDVALLAMMDARASGLSLWWYEAERDTESDGALYEVDEFYELAEGEDGSASGHAAETMLQWKVGDELSAATEGEDAARMACSAQLCEATGSEDDGK